MADAADLANRYVAAVYRSDRRNCLLPNTPLKAKIVAFERRERLRTLEVTTLYTIECQHGDNKWNIQRASGDFHHLHEEIQPVAASLGIKYVKFPNWFRRNWVGLREHRQAVVTLLSFYLEELLRYPQLVATRHVLQFFGISRFSFIPSLGNKHDEALVSKIGGGRRAYQSCTACLSSLSQSEVWLVIKDTFFCLIRPYSADIVAVLLFDSEFNVDFKLTNTPSQRHTLIVVNKCRTLRLKIEDGYITTQLAQDLKLTAKNCIWSYAHPYNSFAPTRKSMARWFVDGRDYFSEVCRAIESAKEDIFIADWWLSPELYLRRPPYCNEDYRLDRVLARKAAEGVKVCVIVYKNVEMAVGINSAHTKKVLQEAHPYIAVQRHPDHPPDGVWLWAHHEKIVVVDQREAYIGGLDLCFGRDDNRVHELTDVYHEDDMDSSGNSTIPEEVASEAESCIFIKVLSAEHLPEHKVVATSKDGKDKESLRARLEDMKKRMRLSGKPASSKLARKETWAAGAKSGIIKLRDRVRLDDGTVAADMSFQSQLRRQANEDQDIVYAREGEGTARLDDLGAVIIGLGGGGGARRASKDEHTPVAKLQARHTMSALPTFEPEQQERPGLASMRSEIAPRRGHLSRMESAPLQSRELNSASVPDIAESNKRRFSAYDMRIRLTKMLAGRPSTSGSNGTVDPHSTDALEARASAPSAHHRKSLFHRSETKDGLKHEQELNERTAQVSYTAGCGGIMHKSESVQYVGGRVEFTGTADKFIVTDDTSHISYVLLSTSDGTDDILVNGEMELHQLVEESPTQLALTLQRKVNETWISAGVLHLEYVFYKKTKPAIKRHPTWIGKDYSNPVIRDFFNLECPDEDSIDRWTAPRMPWQCVAPLFPCLAYLSCAARDVARHYIQRWNFVKSGKAKYDHNIPYLLPKLDMVDQPPLPEGSNALYYDACEVQILRSSSLWSSGILTEHSIQTAYIEAIGNAHHYIYIENQFFVTSLPNDGVANKIGDALFNRIVKAHAEEKRFRVYVIMPLTPGFEGEFGPNAAGLQVVMHWQFRSINRGSDSLLQRLEQAIGDWRPYISFAGLRKYDILYGKPVENQLYVHSKLLIADDVVCICGSANINDRSMLGSRDSEIAAIVKDVAFEDTTMDGQPYKAGRFAYSLRQRIFSEHLGLTSSEAGKDPVDSEFWDNVWHARIKTNTDIFEEALHTLPNNHIETWHDLADWRKEPPLATTDPDAAKELLKGLQGHIVDFPYNFLAGEYLAPVRTSKEAWVPMKTFT